MITASNELQVLLEGNCNSGVAQDYISLVDEIYNTFWYIDILSINLLRTGSKVIVFLKGVMLMLYVITFIVGELFGVFAMCLLQIGRYNEMQKEISKKNK